MPKQDMVQSVFSWVISMPKQVLVQQGETANEGSNTDDVRPQLTETTDT